MPGVRAWVAEIRDRFDILGIVAAALLLSLFTVGVLRARSALTSTRADEVTSEWRSHLDALDCPALATEKDRLHANVDSDTETRAAFDYAATHETLLHC